jgi:hypothetical protein
MYPEYAEINGKQYKIDTSYKTALRCFEVINDETIHDYERALAVIYLLFDIVPQKDDEINAFLQKATYYLQCGKKPQKNKEQDMDFEQDKGYIMSSFMSDYHIDLNNTDMHFWQFVDLIEGLTESSILNRVRDIRNYDLSQEKDEKRRKQLIESKKAVALKKKKVKLTEEQTNMMDKIFKTFNLRKE